MIQFNHEYLFYYVCKKSWGCSNKTWPQLESGNNSKKVDKS